MQDETQKDLLTQMKILTTTVVVQAVVLLITLARIFHEACYCERR